MNRKKRILAISAAAVMALVLATGWTVLAGDDWPPEVYQVSSPTGTWTVTSPQFAPGRFGIASYGAEDLRTGRLSGVVELPGDDPTLDGLAPDGESLSPQYVTFVRTGSGTFQKTGVWYIVGSAEPKVPAWILVLNVAAQFIDPDTYEWEGTLSIYSAVAHPGHMFGDLPDQDQDNDGRPDAGQLPVVCMPINGVCHRVAVLPPCEPTPMPGAPQP